MTVFLRPQNLSEAYLFRAEHPDYVALAGGTDFMVGTLHRPPPPGVIDLFGLTGLGEIALRGERLHIGAGVTYAQLLRSELVQREASLLCACAAEVGAIQIQERGTLGGNVGTSSPVGDTLPVLLALDAELLLGSSRGQRRLAYQEFLTGYRQTALGPDELIVAVELPLPGEGLHTYWRKVGTRRAQAISKVMVAAAARLEEGRITYVRLAMGAVADRPVRLSQTEALMLGQPAGEALAERVRGAVRDEIKPISDVRSTKDYRLEVAANLAARFVLELQPGEIA